MPHDRIRTMQDLTSEPRRRRTRRGNTATLVFASALVVVSLIGVAVLVLVSSSRPLTHIESVLLQVVILGAGIGASWLFAQSSASKAAEETMRLHARPAFRTVLILYESLSRLSFEIHRSNEENPDVRLERAESIVNEQIEIGRSALEDWRDIVPEDMEEIERRWIERRNSRDDNSS